MKTIKQLGIYIDDAKAFLMELINQKIVSRDIEFERYEDQEEAGIDPKNIVYLSNYEHRIPAAYYVEICDIISNYHQVVLFGPTDAINVLFNLLEFDHSFDAIKIQHITTDKLTDIQMHDFVQEYYLA